jgi:regulator of protease activity HflC (stomatin/prohibitin superfamily)
MSGRSAPSGNLWQRFWWFFILLGITFICMCVMIPQSFVTIGAGMVGVMFDPLSGGVQPAVLTEGLQTKPFWVSVDTYTIKTQEFTHTMDKVKAGDQGPIYTAAKDNLFVDVDITVLARIDPLQAPKIRQTIGVDGVYQGVVIDSQIRSSVRDVIARYDASSIYSTESRGTVEQEVMKTVANALANRGVVVEATLLKGIYPPKTLMASIEQKKQAEQDAQRMEYVLQKETLEAQRVVIQARGITEAQGIIQQTLTPAYLHYLWLQKLSEHNNVIYVPVEGNFPMFKDMDNVDTVTKIKSAPPVIVNPLNK